jgi:hypothetical protein
MSSDLGMIQRRPGEGMGGSLTAHIGGGLVPTRILVANVDLRGDVAAGGSRFAIGGSLQGGLPIGSSRILARAGVWHAVASTSLERTVVPSFELAGFVALRDHSNPAEPKYGSDTAGIVFGIREDLDEVAYTTLFVGLALYFAPGY